MSLSDNELLKYAVENGMIDTALLRKELEMRRREEILSKHPYRIWKGNDGRWRTYLLPEDGKRKMVNRQTEKDLKDIVVSFYEENEKHSFKNRYDVWVQRQENCGRAENTIYKYEKDYDRFFKGDPFERMKVENITDEDISLMIIDLLKRKDIPYKALKGMFGYMNGVFEKCIIDKIIKENPCKYIDLPIYKKYCKESKDNSVENRTLSRDESKSLLEKLDDSYQKKPNYIVQYALEFSMYTGMRVGELSGLSWDCVDFKRKTLTICKSEKFNRKSKTYYISSTKNDKTRVIPLTKQMEEVLLKVRSIEEENGFLSEFVFSDSNGRVHCRRISDCARNRTMSKEFSKPKSIHAIRRTVNSELRCKGVPAVVAASLIGNTERVNESNYSYDISGMEYKSFVFTEINNNIRDYRNNQK